MTSEEKPATLVVEEGADEVVKERRPRGKSSRHSPRYTAKWTDDDIQERGVTGTVVSFVCRDASGTIARESGDDDDTLFVHFSNIVKPNAEHLVATLAEGELVQFDIAKTANRTEAVNVTGVKGAAVAGNAEAPSRGVANVPLWAIQLIPAVEQPTRHYGQKMVHKESGVETDSEEGETETEWLPKWEEEDIVDRGVLGTIKWFQMVRGFGFVARDDAGETADLFVHRTSVLKPNPRHIIESLADEERIKFDMQVVPLLHGRVVSVKTDKGQEAINVTAADGGSVIGSSYAPAIGIGYVPQWAFDMLSVYRSRHGKGTRRIRRPQGGRFHVRRRTSRTDDDTEKTPSGKDGRKRQSHRHRKPRKVEAEEADADATKLAEDVEKVKVEN